MASTYVFVRQQRMWPAYFTRKPPRRRVLVEARKTVPATLPNLFKHQAFLAYLMSKRRDDLRRAKQPEERVALEQWLTLAEKRLRWLERMIDQAQERHDQHAA